MSLTLPPPQVLPSNTFAGVREALWLSNPAPTPLTVKTLLVKETLTVDGATTLRSTLDVSGNTTVGGTLGATGNITTAADIFATGNVSGANFNSAGTITSGALANLAVLNVVGTATVGGSLNITQIDPGMGTLDVPVGCPGSTLIVMTGNKIFLSAKAYLDDTQVILVPPFANAIPTPATFYQPIGQRVEFTWLSNGNFNIVVGGTVNTDVRWSGAVFWI